ncbi:ABC transporter permease [Lederbergia citrea]|uniref:ABC transporter permease n=1 Tax=Lederbergia citrea TaxID=2833581 RepID=A0A942UT64_9BACI|nr:ABC transporter permease [Lederbergia citrea]MBS4205382.1 ABC transporter permease [Lederbergia citrea]MBS4224303.1 ABC transporter permease [Lederbergia citrea]
MKIMMNQCRAEILRLLRNPYYVFWSLFMPILFYIIFTKVINLDVPDKKLWEAHYLMSMATFSVMGSAIMTMGIRIVQERAEGWTTFIRVTPLSRAVYFFAKMTGQTMIHLFSIVVIFLVGGLMNGISLPPYEWIMSGCWILLGSLPFLGLGTLVGTMKRVDTASGVSNVVYMLLAITGGMWMPMDILPKTVQTIGAWLPAYNFGNGAWEIIRGQSPEIKNILILAGYLLLFMVLSTYIRRKQEAV